MDTTPKAIALLFSCLFWLGTSARTPAAETPRNDAKGRAEELIKKARALVEELKKLAASDAASTAITVTTVFGSYQAQLYTLVAEQ